MKGDRYRRQAHQLAADQAPRRIRRKRATATTCSTRTVRSPPAARCEQIAAGKGRAPKPFMLAEGNGKGKADAVWHSNRGRGRREARATKQGRTSRAVDGEARKRSSSDARFRRAAALRHGRKPPSGEDWVHEIKFDGYRMQLRVEDGEAALKTRKGLDWTEKFPAIAKEAAGCPTRSSTARSSRSMTTATAGFFGAAGGAVRRQDRRSDLLRVRSVVCRGRRSARACRWSSARSGWSTARKPQAQGKARSAMSSISTTDGETVLESAQQRSASKASSPSGAMRPIAPAAAESWTKAKVRAGHEVVIGAWTDHARQIPFADGRRPSRATISPMSATSAPATARTRSGG